MLRTTTLTARRVAAVAATLALSLPLMAGATPAVTPTAAPAATVAIPDHTLFVDPPTRFAFIKLPSGWKFVGQIDAQAMNRLPAGTVSALLPADAAVVAER